MDDLRSGISLKSRYYRLEPDRFVFLDRARRCSELTIPTLIPPLGHNKTTRYYTPWQGIGARGVNNLASKLLLSLLPPNSPFFRLTVDDFTMEKIAGQPGARAMVEKGLAKVERAVQDEIEGTGMRSPIFLSLKHLIVGGNCCVYFPKDGGTRIFAIDSYVARRDPEGNLLEVIIREQVDPEAVSDIIDKIEDTIEGENVSSSEAKDKTQKGSGEAFEEVVELFTRFWREEGKWKMCQEVLDKIVPGSEGSWPIEKPPLLALRWVTVEGEDYGRSYVEEYMGDLVALEALSKAIVEASAVAAKIVFLVSPNGVTKAEDITQAESGEAVVGHKDDVHCLQSEKQADLKITFDAIKEITERLSYAFLLNSAIQRNGERVTAEEIRFMAGDLEDALGGVYSILSQELQLPMVMRIMDRMQKQKRLPEFPKGVIKPEIVTGLEALGRGHDLSKLQQFMQLLQGLPPEITQQYINWDDLLNRVGTALMIDTDGLIKSPEEVQQAQQQAQQSQQQQQMTDLAGKAAPAAIKALSDHAMAAQQPPSGPPGPPAPNGN